LNFIQKAAFGLVKNHVNDYIKNFLSGEDVSQYDSPGQMESEIAMKYSAVFGCNRVLSETKACMPIVLHRKKPKGEREPVNDLRIFDILHNAPNEEMSQFAYDEACMTSLNLGGNSVSEKLLNKFGEVVGLYPYRHEQVHISRNKDTNKLIYTIRQGSKEKILRRDQVYHVAGLSYDGIIGLSPLEYTASAIRLGKSYELFGENLYRNGANPSLIFKFPGALGDEAYQRLKKDLTKNYSGLKNAGKPMLLEEGGEAIPLTIKPVDAQLIESKRFSIEDIARIYRVPLHLLQDLSRSTNNNIEHQSLEFVMYTMLPWAKRFEACQNQQLLTQEERKAGYFLEYNMSGLLRGDAASRATAYATGRQWGWLSVNDIRKLENWNSIPNGDIYLQPSNMIEAGKAGDKIKALTEDYFNTLAKGGEIKG
jgi:HK97 family phage portal protein